MVNDLAESQLIAAIKSGNMSGIIFWLRNNHPSYKNRLDITAHLEKEDALTPEQEAIVREALRLASLTPSEPEAAEEVVEPQPQQTEISNHDQADEKQ